MREEWESKDIKSGSIIKDKNGKLVTDRKGVLQLWKDYFKELVNHELQIPSAVEGDIG